MDLFVNRNKVLTNSPRLHTNCTNRSVTRTPLPDIHCDLINSLKMECQYLTQDDNCFRALKAKYVPPAIFYTRPMHTQLRSMNRKRWDEQKRVRLGSYDSGKGNEVVKVRMTIREPMEVVGLEGRTKFASQEATDKKNKQNMPMIYRKRNLDLQPEKANRSRKKILPKGNPVKGFEKMVKQLKAILMNT